MVTKNIWLGLMKLLKLKNKNQKLKIQTNKRKNFIFFIFGFLYLLFSIPVISAEQGGDMQATKNIIELPQPKIKSNVSLEEAIYQRRSKRKFEQKDLSLEQIGQLLWAAQGITNEKMGFRSVPSAGALYPLEIYAVKKDGLFHYVPDGHKIKLISGEDLRGRLSEAAWGQSFVKEVPLDIIICAVYSRVTSKYGERGARYVDMEAGHTGQNVQLEAVSLGLGSCVVGAFDPAEVSALLSLPKEEEPLYIIPVGYTK